MNLLYYPFTYLFRSPAQLVSWRYTPFKMDDFSLKHSKQKDVINSYEILLKFFIHFKDIF